MILSLTVIRITPRIFRWSVGFSDECLESGREPTRAKAREAGLAFRNAALGEYRRKVADGEVSKGPWRSDSLRS